MRRIRPLLIPVLMLAAFALQVALAQADESPILLEKIEETGLYRMTLSERAIERIGLETTAVRAQPDGVLVIPYSAVMYDLNGETWAYISPEPYLFYRAAITVERIEGDLAYLSAGPEVDTEVVFVAASLLWGAETGGFK